MSRDERRSYPTLSARSVRLSAALHANARNPGDALVVNWSLALGSVHGPVSGPAEADAMSK